MTTDPVYQHWKTEQLPLMELRQTSEMCLSLAAELRIEPRSPSSHSVLFLNWLIQLLSLELRNLETYFITLDVIIPPHPLLLILLSQCQQRRLHLKWDILNKLALSHWFCGSCREPALRRRWLTLVLWVEVLLLSKTQFLHLKRYGFLHISV